MMKSIILIIIFVVGINMATFNPGNEAGVIRLIGLCLVSFWVGMVHSYLD